MFIFIFAFFFFKHKTEYEMRISDWSSDVCSSDLKCFIAVIVPGLIGMLGYGAAVAVVTYRRPEIGPPGPRVDWRNRIRALGSVSGILILFLVVIGGLYLGVFTPTEAAGIGATAAYFFVLFRRRATWRALLDDLTETAKTTGAIFFVVIGASIFSNFINIAGMPGELGQWISHLEISPIVVLLAVLVIYVCLGCVLESLSMILLTVPVFYPVVAGLDFGDLAAGEILIWFGILVVVITEISLITPPVGMNVFVLKGILREVPTGVIFAGILPFLWSDVIRLALLVFFPALSLFLPRMMG